jgi:hypothetical protein
MANRRLTNEERAGLAPLLDDVSSKLCELAGGDESLHWALRRRLWNQLQYDERLKPPYRAALKKKKRIEQAGLCNMCKSPLPKSHAVLDRYEAMGSRPRYSRADARGLHEQGRSTGFRQRLRPFPGRQGMLAQVGPCLGLRAFAPGAVWYNPAKRTLRWKDGQNDTPRS